MTDCKTVEQQIRRTLETQNDAIELSNALFSRDGLFNQLATTEHERRELANSQLFKEAQRRLNELQRLDATEFSQNVEEARRKLFAGTRLIKIEQA